MSAVLTLQRDIGWKDALTAGKGWNVGQTSVGQVLRIPLEGLEPGLQQQEEAMISELSPESAKGRAIVPVPKDLESGLPIEVLVHFHGYTESSDRPFAGWRAFTPEATKTKDRTMRKLRQGIDKEDVAPVRDVALDQAEEQLEESGQVQTIVVLPQGGLRSQFGPKGDYNFDAGPYVGSVVKRLVHEGIWKKEPTDIRISMAGHSGAGATLAKMARAAVNRQRDKSKATKHQKKQVQGSPFMWGGDLVLLDAINGDSELGAFKDWALMRSGQDLDALKSRGDGEKLTYLRSAPKLRAYYSAANPKRLGYEGRYKKLDQAITAWFTENTPELGPYAGCLRANFSPSIAVPVAHEELMRGVSAGEARAGAGTILDALRALPPPQIGAAADCPATPASGA